MDEECKGGLTGIPPSERFQRGQLTATRFQKPIYAFDEEIIKIEKLKRAEEAVYGKKKEVKTMKFANTNIKYETGSYTAPKIVTPTAPKKVVAPIVTKPAQVRTAEEEAISEARKHMTGRPGIIPEIGTGVKKFNYKVQRTVIFNQLSNSNASVPIPSSDTVVTGTVVEPSTRTNMDTDTTVASSGLTVEQQLANALQELTALKAHVTNLETDNKVLQREIKEKDAIIAKQETALDGVRKERDQFQEEKRDLEHEKEALCDEAETEVAKRDSKIETLEEENASLKAENERLNKQLVAKAPVVSGNFASNELDNKLDRMMDLLEKKSEPVVDLTQLISVVSHLATIVENNTVQKQQTVFDIEKFAEVQMNMMDKVMKQNAANIAPALTAMANMTNSVAEITRAIAYGVVQDEKAAAEATAETTVPVSASEPTSAVAEEAAVKDTTSASVEETVIVEETANVTAEEPAHVDTVVEEPVIEPVAEVETDTVAEPITYTVNEGHAIERVEAELVDEIPTQEEPRIMNDAEAMDAEFGDEPVDLCETTVTNSTEEFDCSIPEGAPDWQVKSLTTIKNFVHAQHWC